MKRGREGSALAEQLLRELPRPRGGEYAVTDHACGAERRTDASIAAHEVWHGAAETGAVAEASRHYRAQGWVVKGGLNYGCDLVLYRPPFPTIHSEYCVWVCRHGDSPPWRAIQGLMRICEQVKKKLAVCVVSEAGVRDFCIARDDDAFPRAPVAAALAAVAAAVAS
eukprot:TRINITY_DN14525_c0_g1_i1.p1 TRINITY_DN14525_c0_g1~~TRINITY_DN14525_c0_g1_i1.p1  ORF type:complete len:167 (+),score=41.46 TRINITY_DN14525_c0_g1_i1:60-560(+)